MSEWNSMTTYKVMNGSTDVTANYAVTATAGTLTITAATPIIIPSEVSAERILLTSRDLSAIFKVDLKSIICFNCFFQKYYQI